MAVINYSLSITFQYFLALSFLLSICSFAAASSVSVHDALRHNGLPIGLLPTNVLNFSLDATSGRFELLLRCACNAKFENQLHYDYNVTGTLSYGQIGGMSGVSAQELFLWFPVKGIRVDIPSSGLIYFDVGVIYKQFSLSLFESPPDCTEVTDSPPQLVFRDGRIVNSELSQSRPGNLGYEAKQGNALRAVS